LITNGAGHFKKNRENFSQPERSDRSCKETRQFL